MFYLMVDEQKSPPEAPLVNIERLEKLVSLYKFPIILAVLGIGLLTFAIVLIIQKNITSEDNIEFITEATESARKRISIDIEGAVISPGVYVLNDENIIHDALIAAGGLSVDADREWVSKKLNRAAKLIDGGKIYIPKVGEYGNEKSGIERSGKNSVSKSNKQGILGVTEGKININSASKSQLESLKGVGPVTAQKIIDSRPYQSVDELKNSKVIGSSLFSKIEDLLTVY